MLQPSDLDQIKFKGIDPSTIEKQIDHFIHGFPYIQLIKPAKPNDGILQFNLKEQRFFIDSYHQNIQNQRVFKFVPASGAASRMFKHLFEFRQQYRGTPEDYQNYISDNGFNSVHYFITHLNDIAFFHQLIDILAKNHEEFAQILEDKRYDKIIDYILTEKGLDYSNLPKALITFHNYPEGARTAAEEHMIEAAHYAQDEHRVARIHFTISPEHLQKFKILLNKVSGYYESIMKVKFEITFSIQKQSTDTIAVDDNNQPFRNADGSLLFRPGGHGALLQNLNEIDSDIIFIKNIDNIVPDRLKGSTYYYKKLIGGYLLWIKNIIFNFLTKVNHEGISPEALEKMITFTEEKLFQVLPSGFLQESFEDQVSYLKDLLNKPIRVCGMVRNEGEPGGGPFWVQGPGNKVSLQIVESSQINLKDPIQKQIVADSTHFNPVDLVCCIKDYTGRQFDLSKFIDEKTGFISHKSSEGRILKALELPGLWNGAMANWITIFIEVPIITFNPVKTVNDLLRKEHLMT